MNIIPAFWGFCFRLTTFNVSATYTLWNIHIYVVIIHNDNCQTVIIMEHKINYNN